MAYKSLVVATAFAMAGLAHADSATITVTAGGPDVSALGASYGGLTGTGSLAFSADLIGALSTAAIVTTGVEPGELIESEDAEGNPLISASAKVTDLTANVDNVANTFTATKVATAGGALMTAAKKNFATTGGSLSVTGITVDLATKAIYADLTGGNGVGSLSQVHVWDYATIEGDVTFPIKNGTTPSLNTLRGLTITENAFGIFAQSLGLRTGGINAMRAITDYGVMTANISVNVTAVPEPSTYALAGVGLLVAGFAAKRRRAA